MVTLNDEPNDIVGLMPLETSQMKGEDFCPIMIEAQEEITALLKQDGEEVNDLINKFNGIFWNHFFHCRKGNCSNMAEVNV